MSKCWLLLTCLLFGCAGSPPETSYYLLRGESADTLGTGSVSIALGRVAVGIAGRSQSLAMLPALMPIDSNAALDAADSRRADHLELRLPPGRRVAGPPPTAAPNVLLIVLDTVRADALGAYGGKPGTSPFMNRFAEQGTLFERATSTAPWTLTSTASMLTSTPCLTRARNCSVTQGSPDTYMALSKIESPMSTMLDVMAKPHHLINSVY